MKLIKDLGILKAKPTSKQSFRHGMYECPSCLKAFKTRTANVKNGHTRICRSCSMKNARTKHGDSFTSLYSRWSGIKSRCFNKNELAYKNYGGRGISICEEWKNNYKAFKKWAYENGYEEHLTIDRIDNDGNYEPNNCRWVNMSTQIQNRRNVKLTRDDVANIRKMHKNGVEIETIYEKYEKKVYDKHYLKRIINKEIWNIDYMENIK